MRQMLHECLDDLSQAKHLLDQLHRGQSDGNSPDQARHTLERLAGVLHMAGLVEAAELVEASSRSVQEQLIDQLRQSLAAVSQFVELETVVLSSYAPKSVCEDICRKLQDAVPGVRAIAGTLTPSPKAVGAASLPYSSRFMVE